MLKEIEKCKKETEEVRGTAKEYTVGAQVEVSDVGTILIEGKQIFKISQQIFRKLIQKIKIFKNI